MSDRRRLSAALVGIVVLGVFWGLVWRDLHGSILFRVPLLDEAHYLNRAAEISAGDLLPDDVFFMSPLYPYLVALTGSGRIVDPAAPSIDPPYGIRLFQLACWLGVLVLLLATGRRILPGLFSILPAVIFLLYRPAAILTSSVLLEMPLTFLVTLILFLLGRDEQKPRGIGWAILIGVLIAVAGLLRGVGLVIWLPAALRLRRIGYGHVLIMTAAMLLILTPVVVHNSIHAGRPAALTMNMGLNAYLGNGPEANGGYRILPDYDVGRDPEGRVYLSERTGRSVVRRSEADALWLELTMDQIKMQPGRALRLLLKKLRLFFAGLELPQLSAYSSWIDAAPALHLLFWPWWLLSCLGLAGLVLYGRDAGSLRIWSLSLILLVLVHVLFFIATRYRLVAVPALAVFASLFLTRLPRASNRKKYLSAAVVLVSFLIVQPWGFQAEKDELVLTGLRNEAARHFHAATAAEDQQTRVAELYRAENLYRRAIVAFPGDAASYTGLARLLVLAERDAVAESVLLQGAAAAADKSRVRAALVSLYVERGQIARALPILNILVREEPENPEYLHNYSVALAQTGRQDMAVEMAVRLLSVASQDPRGYVDLGVILARSGHRDRAREIFREGLTIAPENPELLHNLKLLTESE